MITLYAQLSFDIETQIHSGLIQPNEKLPSIRVLMKRYDVSKNTVINALNDLEAKGFIEAKNKVGFFVKQQVIEQQRIPTQYFPELTSQQISLPDLFYRVMAKEAAFDILPTEKARSSANSILSLNKHIRRAFREDVHFKASHYDPPQGNLALREQVSARYRQRATAIGADDLCITSGCQHGLMLALMAICQPGDSVIVESPAFYGALLLLSQLKLNVIEVSSHPVSGIDLAQFEQALITCNVKACVLTPNFATPTGSMMPFATRELILNLANKYDVAVIEDDIYGELSFGNPVNTLKAIDTDNRVVLVGSVSKCLSRDLRIGWIVGSRWQASIEQLKLTSQLASSSSVQSGLASFMSIGDYRKHLVQTNDNLQRQKHQLIDLLLNTWPGDVKFTDPVGGISLWVELSPGFDSFKLYQQLAKEGIYITPGLLFSYQNDYNNCMRLSFQHHFDAERRQAIAYIGQYVN